MVGSKGQLSCARSGGELRIGRRKTAAMVGSKGQLSCARSGGELRIGRRKTAAMVGSKGQLSCARSGGELRIGRRKTAAMVGSKGQLSCARSGGELRIGRRKTAAMVGSKGQLSCARSGGELRIGRRKTAAMVGSKGQLSCASRLEAGLRRCWALALVAAFSPGLKPDRYKLERSRGFENPLPRTGSPYCLITVPSRLRISPHPPLRLSLPGVNGAFAAAFSSISMPHPGVSLTHRYPSLISGHP